MQFWKIPRKTLRLRLFLVASLLKVGSKTDALELYFERCQTSMKFSFSEIANAFNRKLRSQKS